MAPKSKSIFRQPGVQHFQLVHRSQRDPLINDPEASTHVLKPFERDNVKKVIILVRPLFLIADRRREKRRPSSRLRLGKRTH